MNMNIKYQGQAEWGRTSLRCLQSGKGRLSAWGTVLATISLAWTIVLFLYWPTVQSLVDAWIASRTFRHGFLILPATMYLLWVYREGLSGIMPTRSALGATLSVFLTWSWWEGYAAEDVLWQQVSLVAMFPALLLTLCGTAVFRVLCFPLGLLAFALPVGTAIEGLLQDFTTTFLEFTLNAVGVPLVREGYFITIPSRKWEVATDCAGLRYVLPGLALGYMYAAMVYRRTLRRVAFLILCGMLLILANGVRAFSIIYFDFVGVAEGTDHRVFSYLVYGITIVLLGWIGTFWADDTSEEATPGWVRHLGSA